jgi:hypothetical protein
MASPFKKCEHGNRRNQCTLCLAEAMLSIETFGVVHVSPNGDLELIKLDKPAGDKEDE